MPASFINTGVPHVVYFVDNIDIVNVKELGAKTRYHDYFGDEGTNVNFAEVVDKKTVKIRTYERGVEDETLACGTGSTAAAVIAALEGKCESPMDVVTRSGKILKVYVYKDEDNNVGRVYLEGDALLSYIGTMIDEAWNY